MTVAGIATIPARREQLKQTLESILPQVDKVILSLNNYYQGEYDFPQKVEYEITKGTDEQKFRKVEGDYFFALDDDLIYPQDYVETCKRALEKYDIVTFHGKNFNHFPITSFYREKATRYRCLDKVASDITVQIGGSGCLAFKPQNFIVSLADFPFEYMADIQLSIAAKRQNKRITCLAHEAGWIQYQQVNNTIYDRFRNQDWQQTDLVNEFYAR